MPFHDGEEKTVLGSLNQRRWFAPAKAQESGKKRL